MKSRGMYETPGGTILLAAHRAIESITLDRGAAHLKDELMPRYAEMIYNGFWFAPEREMLQVLIDKSQEMVTGRVRLKVYKGAAWTIGRESPYSLYDQDLVTFEEGAVAYDHHDAGGFIKLNALRLRTLAKRRAKIERDGRALATNRRPSAHAGDENDADRHRLRADAFRDDQSQRRRPGQQAPSRRPDWPSASGSAGRVRARSAAARSPRTPARSRGPDIGGIKGDHDPVPQRHQPEDEGEQEARPPRPR